MLCAISINDLCDWLESNSTVEAHDEITWMILFLMQLLSSPFPSLFLYNFYLFLAILSFPADLCF